jgi:Ran-interacting Mog1 protein
LVWADSCSDFRQVPDNQEVFVDVDTDQSVIVEILESQDPTAGPTDVLAYYFHDLAEANGCGPADAVLSCPAQPLDLASSSPGIVASTASFPAPLSVSAAVCRGTQCIKKFKEDEGNTVGVFMAVFRLGAPISTDILVTLNVPLVIAAGSSSRESVDSNLLSHDGAVVPAAVADGIAVINTVITSLAVLDWGLFASDE